MRYFVTSSKDASIYTDYPNQNAGRDQVLDLFKYETSEVAKSSRILIEFDFTNVSQSIVDGVITNPTFSLDLKTTLARELGSDFVLSVHPISQSWDVGLGKRQDNPKTTDGVSYRFRDILNGSNWDTSGSDFLSTPSASLVFGTETNDATFDITNIVNSYLDGTITNYGLLVRFSGSYETDGVNYGEINFYSSETNTIYRPKIIVEWDDKSFVTGSLTEITDEDTFLTIKGLKREYKANTQYKFRLHTRSMYPTLTYTTGSVYSSVNYIPTGSMYSIVDNVTDEIIVPFSSNSQLSVDSSGNYFNQNFEGWEAERFYRILFKIDDGTSNYQIIDKNFVFKLVEWNGL